MEIAKSDIQDIYPLSPMQQGMLFHTLFSSGNEAPLMQWSCRIEGDVDVPALRRAWDQVIARHAILRTAVVLEDGGEPVQVVFRSVPLPWQERDWRRSSPEDRERSVREFLEEDRQSAFELLEPPLMRVALLRLSDHDSVFVWTFHLLLLDGWSMGMVRNEVWASYEALLHGTELQPPLPRPYRDYIAWHQRQDPARAERFWRRTLRGIAAPTPLVVGRSATDAEDANGGYEEREIRLSAEATRSLLEFARRHRLTLSTIVRAAWALLLGRYSGEPTVVFGAVMSGRPADLAGVESIVGLLVNTLPVRVDIPEDEPVRSWLQRLQEQQSEFLDYESSRLVDVQGWSEVPRGLPLFETILAVQTYPVAGALRSREEKLGIREVRNFERTNYPLTVHVVPGDALSLGIAYDRSRFDRPTIERMLSHFETLLLSLAEDGDRRISDISCLTQRERNQILVEWNQTDVSYPPEATLPHLFEKQVERTPHAEAVVFGEESLTYEQLNDRANRLASYLRRRGVGSEVLVGLCLERSLEMLVGLLGILKAGGAYLPLDPSYPSKRLEFLLEDSGARVVLTGPGRPDSLAPPAVPIVRLDRDWEEIERERPKNLEGGAKPADLAYVIYTSGSTGQPKGTLNTHRGICNRLLWMQDTYRLSQQDRVL
ncbi:MAG TPA: condensation domain-containing protein, partial [Thermoanaerobaculia bacterium]